MCGWQIKLSDPLVTHGPYLGALEIRLGIIKRYRNGSFTLLYIQQRMKIHMSNEWISLLCTGNGIRSGRCCGSSVTVSSDVIKIMGYRDWRQLKKTWKKTGGDGER